MLQAWSLNIRDIKKEKVVKRHTPYCTRTKAYNSTTKMYKSIQQYNLKKNPTMTRCCSLKGITTLFYK